MFVLATNSMIQGMYKLLCSIFFIDDRLLHIGIINDHIDEVGTRKKKELHTCRLKHYVYYLLQSIIV